MLSPWRLIRILPLFPSSGAALNVVALMITPFGGVELELPLDALLVEADDDITDDEDCGCDDDIEEEDATEDATEDTEELLLDDDNELALETDDREDEDELTLDDDLEDELELKDELEAGTELATLDDPPPVPQLVPGTKPERT